MREILFKAKRLDNGEWMEGSFIRGPKSIAYIFPIGGYLWDASPVDLSTVCQYTGLTDKNGVKIFEGDRCVFKFANDSALYRTFWNQEDGRWFVKEVEHGATDSLDWFFADHCTVSGNIHDNV